MVADGLVVGTSGNVSAREGDLVALTPTGADYATLTAAAVTVVDLAGTVLAGDPPSSELPLHLAAYRELGAGAIVHTHGVHATAVSTLVDEVPAVHYAVAMFGGSVRVAPYATYGTPELAANAVAALRGRTGCLLANHGAVTLGATLEAAYDRAAQLDWLCRVWLAASAVGRPRVLSPEELARVGESIATYGAAAHE